MEGSLVEMNKGMMYARGMLRESFVLERQWNGRGSPIQRAIEQVAV